MDVHKIFNVFISLRGNRVPVEFSSTFPDNCEKVQWNNINFHLHTACFKK